MRLPEFVEAVESYGGRARIVSTRSGGCDQLGEGIVSWFRRIWDKWVNPPEGGNPWPDPNEWTL